MTPRLWVMTVTTALLTVGSAFYGVIVSALGLSQPMSSLLLWVLVIGGALGAIYVALWVARGAPGMQPAALAVFVAMRGASPVPTLLNALGLALVLIAARLSHDERFDILSWALTVLALIVFGVGVYVFWFRPDWATPRWAREGRDPDDNTGRPHEVDAEAGGHEASRSQ